MGSGHTGMGIPSGWEKTGFQGQEPSPNWPPRMCPFALPGSTRDLLEGILEERQRARTSCVLSWLSPWNRNHWCRWKGWTGRRGPFPYPSIKSRTLVSCRRCESAKRRSRAWGLGGLAGAVGTWDLGTGDPPWTRDPACGFRGQAGRDGSGSGRPLDAAAGPVAEMVGSRLPLLPRLPGPHGFCPFAPHPRALVCGTCPTPGPVSSVSPGSGPFGPPSGHGPRRW